MREVSNHIRLHHPHIVFLNKITKHSADADYIVLELEAMTGGDLHQFMEMPANKNGLPEYVARWYFQQIVLATEYCHKKFVCNRDIKLENILLVHPPSQNNMHPQVKLCDFGWSKDEISDSDPHSLAGTPAFVAPEILRSHGRHRYHGDAADAWSLGVVLYCLVVGKLPFYRDEDLKLKNNAAKLTQMTSRILAGDFAFPERRADGSVLSEDVKDLILRLLVVNPAQRLSMSMILQHRWTFAGCEDSKKNETLEFNDRLLAKQELPHENAKFNKRLEIARAVFSSLGWPPLTSREAVAGDMGGAEAAVDAMQS